MKFIFKKPYIFLFIGTFLVYLLLLFILSDFGNTLFLALQYAETVSWEKLAFSVFLSLSIGFFVALNTCFAIREYAIRKQCKKGGALTGAGILAGLSIGICPLCVGGLLPLVLGILGISFSFGILPWQGLEIQLGVLAIMIFTTHMFYNKKI